MADFDDCRPVRFNQKVTMEVTEICERGLDGNSAYQIAVINGFVGTEAEWLASLEGSGGSGSGFVVQDDAPSDIRLLWIDSDDNSGSTNSSSLTKLAFQTLGGHRIVKSINYSQVDYADNLVDSDKSSILGITASSATIGSTVQIITSGELIEPSWNWVIGGFIFCASNGLLTQTPPSTGFLCIIGTATSPTSIFIRIGQPIDLI